MQGTGLIAGISHPGAFGCCRGQGWRPEGVRRGGMSWREVLGRALDLLEPWEGLFERRAKADQSLDPISGNACSASHRVPASPRLPAHPTPNPCSKQSLILQRTLASGYKHPGNCLKAASAQSVCVRGQRHIPGMGQGWNSCRG